MEIGLFYKVEVMQQEYLGYLLFPATAAGMGPSLEINAFLECMDRVTLKMRNA